MKRQMKLRNLIFITTILTSAIIILSFGYVSGRQFEEILTESTVNDYQETVSSMEKHVETLITYAVDFTKYMTLDDMVLDSILEYQSMPDKKGSVASLALKKKWDAFSVRLLYSTSMLYAIDVYSGDELMYSYYDDAMDTEKKNIPEEILQEALETDSPIWTDLRTLKQYRSYAKKETYGFAVVKSVRDESMKRIGAIAVFVRESSFSDILESVNEEHRSRFYLVNDENTIVSAVEKTELYADILSTLGLSQEEYKTCTEEGVLLKNQRGQVPVLYVSRNIEEKGVKLVCETAMTELWEQQKNLQSLIGLLMSLALALALVGAWFTAGYVTKPLGELVAVIEGIKTEGKDSHLRFPEGNTGEVGYLGSRFNELMDLQDQLMDQIYYEQRQRRNNEMRLLQAQISPHFLYNTMGIISSLIRLGMPEKALTTIQNLVSFYRLSLSSGKEIITLAEEVELTRNYMALQQLRYVEYMDYTIECDPRAGGLRIPKLTIQPLVENVLHHGLKRSGEKCRIEVCVTGDSPDGAVQICVRDNGAGMTQERLAQVRRSLETGKSVTESFGVLNVNQRLKLMYAEGYHMEIYSRLGEYTQVILYLPGKCLEETENIQNI